MWREKQEKKKEGEIKFSSQTVFFERCMNLLSTVFIAPEMVRYQSVNRYSPVIPPVPRWGEIPFRELHL